MTSITINEYDKIYRVIGFEIPNGPEWVKDNHIRYSAAPKGIKGWYLYDINVPDWWRMAVTYWWNFRPHRVRPYYLKLEDSDFFKELYYISRLTKLVMHS